MTGLGNIVANSGEDFVDELATAIVYEEGTKVFKKTESYLGLDPENSKVDAALEEALTTAEYGTMNLVTVLVTEYALTKSLAVLTAVYGYVKTRRIIKAMIDTFTNLPILKKNPVGFVASSVVGKASDVLVANQSETLALAKMANSSSNNIISAVGQERQNQIILQGQKLKRIDNSKNNIYSIRNNSRDKNMSLYVHKFETGTWADTLKDKKLYYDCTGQDSKIIVYNKAYVDKLNSYANYVTTAKGEIFSNAKASLDLLTQFGAKL